MGRFSTEGPGGARLGRMVLGKWRLDEVLGVGGMAVVYAATHQNGRRVAIKILHNVLSRNAAVRARFLREGYVTNSVDHPGAVAILDQDVDVDGSAFLVMELLSGETLHQRWTRSPGAKLAVPDVLAIVDQVLDVLAAAHDRGIVHRDLKPENLFLTDDGRLKLLDFGIARLHEGVGRTEITQTGLWMGTPAFMPPEQVKSEWREVDARSDLWAVGALMFTMLSGRFVHENDVPANLMLAAATQPAPTLASVAPEVRPEVAAIVDRALAFHRDARWQDARSMQSAVRLALRGPAEAVPDAIDRLAYATTDDDSQYDARAARAVTAPRPAFSATPPLPPIGSMKLGIAGAMAALALSMKIALACVLVARVCTICPEQAAAAVRVDAGRVLATR